MARRLDEGVLRDLLPGSIRDDPKIARITEAVDPFISSITQETNIPVLLARIDELSEPLMDLLAWQFHVDFYEPLGLSLEAKRRLVKGSILWHRRKGTPWAVVRLLKDLGLRARYMDWWKFGGTPYTCRVRVAMGLSSMEKDSSLIRRAIESAKSARTHLDAIEIVMAIGEEKIAEERSIMDSLAAMEESFPWVGLSYDGFWTYGDMATYGDEMVPDLVGNRSWIGLYDSFFSNIRYGDEDLTYDGSSSYDCDIESADDGAIISVSAAIAEMISGYGRRHFFTGTALEEKAVSSEILPMISGGYVEERNFQDEDNTLVSETVSSEVACSSERKSIENGSELLEQVDASEENSSDLLYALGEEKTTDEEMDLSCTREVLYDGTVDYGGEYGQRSVVYESQRFEM